MTKPLFTKTRIPLLALFAAILLILPGKARSQTSLGLGDVAFTGYNAAGSIDTFSFVLLADISANTSISFTDRGFQSPSSWNGTGGTEGTVTWTSSGALARGTEVMIANYVKSGVPVASWAYNATTGVFTANGTVSVTEGTMTNGLNLAGTGDQIIAFQGGGGSITGSGVTILAGIHYGYCSAATTAANWDDVGGGSCILGTNSSKIPPTLTNGTNAFYVPQVSGNIASYARFNCTGTPALNVAGIRTAVYNIANWSTSASSSLTMPSRCLFISSGPTIIGHPSNRTVCVGGSTTFGVTATNPGTYQWQEFNGASWSDISVGAPFSGVNSATLTITGITAAKNGYQYRCRVTNGTSVTSNPGTLTVDVVAGTAAVTPVSCNGGSNGMATVTVTSGTSPYSYSWSPGGGTGYQATGLVANTYTCTVTDDLGCTGQVMAVISEPAQPVSAAVTTVNNVTCPGGSNGNMTVTPSGGTPGYTYLWNTGATTASIFALAGGTYTCTVRDSKNCPTTASATVSQPPAFVTSSSTTSVSCNGGANGTATATVTSGGQPPYTYQWSVSAGSQTTQTATGLTAGTYSCTARDANLCPVVISGIVVSQPTALDGTVVKTDVSCNGGSNGTATVSASGGTSPYSYSWSPSGGTNAMASGLAPNTYTVTVTDNNTCQITRSVTVNQPAATLGGTVTKTDVSCNGGSNGTATVSASGGTAPYSYSWSPSGGTNATATGLGPNTYTVTVTDFNGCQITRSTTLTQPASSLNGLITKTDVSCNGGSNGTATINASGGTTPYTYSWSPSGGTNATATGLGPNTYTVTVMDFNGCQITRTTTVNQPAAALGGTVTKTDVSCNGGSNGTATVSVSGGTTPYSYSWSPSGGTNLMATGLAANTYTVTVTDFNGCQITRSTTLNQPAAALDGTISKTDVACNGGTSGTATVSVTGGTAPYNYSWSPSGGTNATATGLAAGTYTATVTDFNGCQMTRTITLNQPATGMSGTISKTDVSCNGGSNGTATVSITGGTPGYTYSWSPSGGTAAMAMGLAPGTYTCTIRDGNNCQFTRSTTISQPAAVLDGTITQTDVSCNGGSNGTATVSVTGGTTPYSYSWSPSGGTAATATGLAPNTYTVIVTDFNGCQITRSITVNQPAAALDGTISKTDASCNGGSNGTATVSITGGTTPYSYSWSPSGGTAATATGLAPNTYTVIVTDFNGCQITRSITVSQPATGLDGTITKTDVSCNGGTNGTATVSATGGTTPYTYSWSPSGGTNATATGLAANTYTVTVTDFNGCQLTRTTTITQPATALGGSVTKTDVSCNGGSNGTATVSVTGGTTPYSYSWSPGGGTNAMATGLAANTYTVTVTDFNGCQLTRTATITQPATALDGTISKTDVSCNGGANGTATVVATGGTPGYTYSWAPGGGTTATASGLATGTYTCTVTDANSCQITRSITVNQPATALDGTITKTDVSCNGGTNGTATVLATGGTPGYTYSWSPSGGTTATATGLAAGTYTCTITDANGCTISRSITLAQPAALSLSTTSTDITCFGGNNGSAGVTVTGGISPFSYSWSPSGGTADAATGLATGTYTVTVEDDHGCEATASVTITQPAELTATHTQTNVSCFGGDNGEITLTPAGGVAPYDIVWTPGGSTSGDLDNLEAGTYSYTVTDDHGCLLSGSVTVTEPVVLAVAVTATNITCHGDGDGSINLNVTGGTAPYTYGWTPNVGSTGSLTDLEAGTYVYVVTDAKGCEVRDSATVTEPLQLTVSPTSTAVSCFGGDNGTVTLVVSGGTGVYTYTWTPNVGNTASLTDLEAGIYTYVVNDANGCEATGAILVNEPAALAITGDATAVTCNGGSNGLASVTVTGGTQPYTYDWEPGTGNTAAISGLQAGTYVCTVTDAGGCEISYTATVTEPMALTATQTHDNPACNGGTDGTAALTVAGGTLPYTYAWTPGGQTTASLTGLAAGSYNYAVTDGNGCQTTGTVTLTQPDAPVALIARQNITCHGGSDGELSVSVTGGTQPYDYEWTPGGSTATSLTNLLPGNYSVTITDDHGCEITASSTITDPAAISLTQNITLCQGGSITVGTHTYSLPGVYTDVLTSHAGCDSTVITVITMATVNVGTATSGYTITATASGAAYQWLDCNNNFALIPGATAQSYTATANGSFAVRVAQNGCSDTSSCVTIQGMGIAENGGAGFEIKFYPNPTTDHVYIQTDAVIRSVEVMDLSGKKYQPAFSVNKLDFTTLPDGVYLVRVTTGGGNVTVSRVLKM